MARIDLSSYKMDLMLDIIDSPEIVAAIDCPTDGKDGYDPESPDTLIYKRIFPYLRVPSVETKAATYILMAVDVNNINTHNKAFHDIRITLWVMSHQDHMKMPDRSATRIDYISDLVKDVLIDQTKYGLGNLEMSSNREMILNANYLYREMIFYTTDLRKSVCG